LPLTSWLSEESWWQARQSSLDGSFGFLSAAPADVASSSKANAHNSLVTLRLLVFVLPITTS
jgi:hypothetical protein